MMVRLVAMVTVLAITLTLAAAAEAAVGRSAGKCRALEAQGRWAQAKVSSGHVPTAAQMAIYYAKLAWYNANCRS